MLELSGFLKEILCPYSTFISGPMSNRFQSHASRLQLLDYLLTELMTMKMIQKIRPKEEVIIEIVSVVNS